MQLGDAIDMLAGSGIGALGPATWADLGCGDGTFTLALAELLASGSTIHAMDRDAKALRGIPPSHKDVQIIRHRGDFTSDPWPFDNVDGILMANSLHFVEHQRAFILQSHRRMTTRGRFLIVEYDTDQATRWVPYPVSRAALTTLFANADRVITFLKSRRSIYRRAPLYAAMVTHSRT